MLTQALTEAFRCLRGFTSLCYHCDCVSRGGSVVMQCTPDLTAQCGSETSPPVESHWFSIVEHGSECTPALWVMPSSDFMKKWPKTFWFKVMHFKSVSLITNDDAVQQHDRMSSLVISWFCQPWNMTAAPCLHLHVVFSLQFGFQPLLHMWLRS